MKPEDLKAREDELIDDIESSFASPVMRAYVSCILKKDLTEADQILSEETKMSEDDRKILLARCVRDFTAKSMKVVPVAPKDIPRVDLYEFHKSSRYLVRVGTHIFISRAIVDRGEKEPKVRDTEGDQYYVSKIDQIMEIVVEK